MLFRRYWQPALLSRRAARARRPAGARAAAGRGPGRVPRHRRQGRARRRVLPAPPRADVLRPQRRVRAALRLSRLEVRPRRRVRRHAVGAARLAVQDEGHDRAPIPTWEGGGVVWTYMGPPELQPPPPELRVGARAARRTAASRRRSRTRNYLQALEGGLDTAHSSFAHNERLGDTNWIRNRDGAPRLDVERTDYGYTYVSTRNVGDDGNYVRVYHYVMPAQQMRGGVTSWTGIGEGRRAATRRPHLGADRRRAHLGLQHGLELRRERPDHARLVRRSDESAFRPRHRRPHPRHVRAQEEPVATTT